jgi:hypothetical protein
MARAAFTAAKAQREKAQYNSAPRQQGPSSMKAFRNARIHQGLRFAAKLSCRRPPIAHVIYRKASRQLAALAGVIAVTAVMGCAPRQQPTWYNAGATQNDFDRDRYHCVRETLAGGAGAQAHAMAADPNFGRNGGLFGALAPAVANARGDAEQMALYNMCMQAKGYHQ